MALWHKGLALIVLGAGFGCADGRPARAQEPAALTIYNQHFAVVREKVRFDLEKGANNNVTYDRVTGLLEPDSVVLRDPAGKRSLRVLEQNYQTDAVNYQKLLARFEGKTLDFLVQRPGGGGTEIVSAKLIRAGGGNVGVSAGYGFSSNSGDSLNYYYASDIVEMDGKVRFGLPGTPLFPAEAMEGALLRPTLALKLETDRDGPVDTELAYVTRGFTWEADYSVVAPENGDTVTLTGLVTMRNTSGRTFENARIKLMAGDVQKLQSRGGGGGGGGFTGGGGFGVPAPPPVTERSFDEYHLYSLRDLTTLRHREMKQVEFARAENIRATRLYVYDGAKYDPQRTNDYSRSPRYVPETNTKVWVMRELANRKENGLGLPLPKGRMRFYRRDDTDDSLQFVGENTIDHTPANELLRLYTGNAFDLVGERRRVSYKQLPGDDLEETFEIVLRNHKKEPVEVRVVERLHRWPNWEVTKTSHDFTKLEANTIEFRVTVLPEGPMVLTYTVYYDWPPLRP